MWTADIFHTVQALFGSCFSSHCSLSVFLCVAAINVWIIACIPTFKELSFISWCIISKHKLQTHKGKSCKKQPKSFVSPGTSLLPWVQWHTFLIYVSHLYLKLRHLDLHSAWITALRSPNWAMLSHAAKQLRYTITKHAHHFITNLKAPGVKHQSVEECDRDQHPAHPPLSMSWKAGGNEGEQNVCVCVCACVLVV